MANRRWQIFSLVLLSAFVLFGQLDHQIFFASDSVIYSNRAVALQKKPLSQWADVPFSINAQAMHDHPPFVPWMMAAMMKVFGVSSTVAVAQSALVSFATILVVFFIGRLLVSHTYGLWASFCLLLSPQFIKRGRNPMLEPTLMFWIMFAVFCHLQFIRSKDRRWWYALGTGVGLAGAILTKGPPAALILGFIFSLQVLRLIWPRIFISLSISWKEFVKYVVLVVSVPVFVCSLFEAWHVAVTGKSFWIQYMNFGLHKAISEGRRFAELDRWFYLKLFFEFLPWWPIVVLSVPFVFFRKNEDLIRVWAVGALILWGTFFGYSLFDTNEPWLIHIHYAGSALVVATFFFNLFKTMDRFVERYSAGIFLSLATVIAVLATIFPRLFIGYPRPFERFMQEAAISLERKYENTLVSVCIDIDLEYEGPQVLLFYLGVIGKTCNERAPLQMVDLRTTRDIGNHSKFIFAKFPYAIVEKTIY